MHWTWYVIQYQALSPQIQVKMPFQVDFQFEWWHIIGLIEFKSMSHLASIISRTIPLFLCRSCQSLSFCASVQALSFQIQN